MGRRKRGNEGVRGEMSVRTAKRGEVNRRRKGEASDESRGGGGGGGGVATQEMFQEIGNLTRAGLKAG